MVTTPRRQQRWASGTGIPGNEFYITYITARNFLSFTPLMPLGGQGNLTIRGRGQGWGQTLGNGDRNGDSKLKNGDWGRGRELKIKKWGLGTGTQN